MSELSRGPVPSDGTPSVPVVPAPVPSFREAVPTGPRTGPQFVPTGPRSPLLGGDGGRDRVSRTAYLTKHHCGADLLAGLDDDVAGLVARCDPYPLSPVGEVEALLAGRRTWHLRHRRLERRDQFNVPGHPPCHDLLVVAEHRCGHPPPTTWLLPLSPPRPRPETTEEF